MHRYIYIAIASLCILLGAIGIFLPILPTTPFLLAALWAASKGSPKIENWLLTHKRFGPALTAWQERKAIPQKAKYLAVTMMGISWLLMAWLNVGKVVLIIMIVLFVSVSAYIFSKPSA